MSDEPTTMHPMQPLVRDREGVIRFRENQIIGFLFETGKLDLNAIARLPFSDDDRMQLAQLLGYSLSGYGELSYVSDESYNAADQAADALRSSPAVPRTTP